MSPVDDSSPDSELQRRLAAASPADTLRGFFFTRVLGTVRNRVGEAAERRCRQLLPEQRFVPFLSYPATDYLRLLYTAAEMLVPSSGGFEAALETIGRHVTEEFRQSDVGRTALLLVQGRPRSLMEHAPTLIRTTASWGSRTCTFTAEDSCDLSFSGELMPPPVYRGVFHVALESIGCTGGNVEVRSRDLLEYTLLLSWKQSGK